MNSFVSVGFVIIINPEKYVDICCLHCTCIDEIKKIMMMDQTFINNNLNRRYRILSGHYVTYCKPSWNKEYALLRHVRLPFSYQTLTHNLNLSTNLELQSNYTFLSSIKRKFISSVTSFGLILFCITHLTKMKTVHVYNWIYYAWENKHLYLPLQDMKFNHFEWC